MSAVNDNKDYYDYSSLFQDRVESVACVRTAGLDGCFELQNFLRSELYILYTLYVIMIITYNMCNI